MRITTPESVGFSSARLARLDAAMQRYVDDGKLPGLIATVARRGETVHFGTYGMMDMEAGKPMAPDAIFRIASMSKPITSVAIMMLYEEGAFNLNTPIYEFLPAFKDTKVLVEMTDDEPVVEDLVRPITFRHLFTHTAGFSYGWDPEDPVDQLYQSLVRQHAMGEKRITLGEQVTALAELPLAFQPGTNYRYSYAIDVLGRLVEVISGTSFDVFLQERVFDPLGMVDTGFHVPEAEADRLPPIYSRADGSHPLERLESPPWAPSTTPATLFSGGGGLASTTQDYARFAQMLVNGGELDGVRLLSPMTIAMYHVNQAPAEALAAGYDGYAEGYGYSLGTRVLLEPAKSGMAGSVGEFGWGGAFGTYFWVDPVAELYGILMTQCPDPLNPKQALLKQMTYQALVA